MSFKNTETVNMMSRCIVTEMYISNLIILQYLIFSDGVSRVNETEEESGIRSIPGSKGVVVVFVTH